MFSDGRYDDKRKISNLANKSQANFVWNSFDGNLDVSQCLLGSKCSWFARTIKNCKTYAESSRIKTFKKLFPFVRCSKW